VVGFLCPGSVYGRLRGRSRGLQQKAQQQRQLRGYESPGRSYPIGHHLG
jgi:hypothetical protein